MTADELTMYLRPTEAIDSDNDQIRAVARSLTSHCGDNGVKAVKLFNFVRDRIHYNIYMISTYFEDFRASLTLEREKGYCVQKAILLAALGRAADIPTRLVFAKIRNHRLPDQLVKQIGTNVLPSHGYGQFYLGGNWVSVTPAFDRHVCEHTGFPVVEFDGVHDAVLPSHDLSGRPFVDYLESYEPQDDLPFPWLKARIARIWGDKRSWLTDEDGKDHAMPSGFVF